MRVCIYIYIHKHIEVSQPKIGVSPNHLIHETILDYFRMETYGDDWGSPGLRTPGLYLQVYHDIASNPTEKNEKAS